MDDLFDEEAWRVVKRRDVVFNEVSFNINNPSQQATIQIWILRLNQNRTQVSVKMLNDSMCVKPHEQGGNQSDLGLKSTWT